MKSLRLCGMLAGAALLTAGAAANGQVTFYTGTSQIVNSDGLLPFSDITQNGQTLVNYMDAGLTVDVNDFAFVFTPCGFNNPNIYYPNGGVLERIVITKTDGSDFSVLEMSPSHGFSGCNVYMWATAYLNGNPVQDFDADLAAGVLIGFSGNFDELRIGSYQDAATRDTHNEAALNAFAIDNMEHGNAGGGYTLNVTGSCPGTVNVAWSGAQSNRQQGIVFAGNTGSFTIPGGPCGGTVLGLGTQNIRLVNTVSTGNGSGNVNGQAGSGACGGYLQLVTVANPCETSNVDQLP